MGNETEPHKRHRTFFVYPADTARMLDVFHVDLGADAAIASGTWLPADE